MVIAHSLICHHSGSLEDGSLAVSDHRGTEKVASGSMEARNGIPMDPKYKDNMMHLLYGDSSGDKEGENGTQ